MHFEAYCLFATDACLPEIPRGFVHHEVIEREIIVAEQPVLNDELNRSQQLKSDRLLMQIAVLTLVGTVQRP